MIIRNYYQTANGSIPEHMLTEDQIIIEEDANTPM